MRRGRKRKKKKKRSVEERVDHCACGTCWGNLCEGGGILRKLQKMGKVECEVWNCNQK